MGRKPKKMTWVPLLGQIDPTADGFTFNPTPLPQPAQGQKPFAIAKSDVSFSSGSVTFTGKLNAKDDRIQVVLNHHLENQVFVGLNTAGAAYGIMVFKNSQWEPIAIVGSSDILVPNRDYSIRVDVLGSLITLYVDGVEVCKGFYVIQSAQVAVFVSSDTPITIRGFAVSLQKPTAFVVIQFTDEFNALFEEVIRPVCEEFDYTCVRADDIYNTGLIIDDITRSIREAAVVIADITPNNPNVFYEVGYSHGLNKPTILLSDRKRDRLPFDVSGFRTLFYDNTIGGKSTVEERLRSHLKSIRA